MALVSQCEACGKVGDTVEQIGMILRRDYCSQCAIDVHSYLRDRDRLHSQLAESWDTGLLSLKAGFLAKFPTGHLPDEA